MKCQCFVNKSCSNIFDKCIQRGILFMSLIDNILLFELATWGLRQQFKIIVKLASFGKTSTNKKHKIWGKYIFNCMEVLEISKRQGLLLKDKNCTLGDFYICCFLCLRIFYSNRAFRIETATDEPQLSRDRIWD